MRQDLPMFGDQRGITARAGAIAVLASLRVVDMDELAARPGPVGQASVAPTRT
jgi:hypothetical protein